MSNLEIHRARDFDYESYAVFQRAAFRDLLERTGASDSHMTADFFRWKYRPPSGEGRIATISCNGVIVSSCAAMPIPLSAAGKSAVGWHCVDVATLPGARRQGWFRVALSSLVESLPVDEFVFAFPNASSLPVFLELGFVENVVVTTLVGPLARLVRRRSGMVRRVERFAPQHEVRGCSARHAPRVQRRYEYLNWRYADHPVNRYACFVRGRRSFDGLCVVRKASIMARDFALVMELAGSTPSVQSELLKHAADWAVGCGLGKLAVLSSALPRTTLMRSLLLPVPGFLLPKRQVLVVRAPDGSEKAATRFRWAIQTGDWDVF